MPPKATQADSSGIRTVCGEIVSKDSTDTLLFPVLAKPHPLRTELVQAFFPVGASLSQVLGPNADDTLSVTIEGEYIPREMWERIRPKAGTQIVVVRYPEGRTVKKIIGVILLVLIAIYAPYLLEYMYAAYGMWGAVAAIGITLLATMAAYALIPPPEMPKMDGGSGAEFNRLNAITGTSNQATQYGVIPMVIGECRFYPTLAANPFTEISGDQQYLRMLFDLGWGDLDISDIKIGETPISTFDGVDYEISTDPDLFSDDMFEVSLAESFNNGEVLQKTTQVGTDEISFDLVFPGGLFAANEKGDAVLATTTFSLKYRAVGSGTWLNVSALPATDRKFSTSMCTWNLTTVQVKSSARKTLRVGVWFKPPAKGQYEVQLTRHATTYGSGAQANAKFDSAQLASFRSIKRTNPSKTGTLKLALRIQASEQLNGVINQLSVLGQQKIRVYDDTTGTWSAPQVNFNPAWVYHWLLTTCDGVAVKVADDRVDLDAFVAWAADCDAKGFTCKGMLDRGISFGELARLVLAAGRASFAMRDGKYSVLYDRDGLVPVQHFSPANSADFSGQRVFVDVPHALRCRFQNPALNWQEDELIVLDDGYTYEGKDARGNASALPPATKFETLTIPYVTEPEAVWRIARYHLAQGKFRPNIYTWTADVENLVCTRGDLVYYNHDVTDWGTGFGLISNVVRNGSNQVTSIIVAEPIELADGLTHSIRVRGRDGSTNISNISSVTDGTTIVLATPMPEIVDTGDLFLVGNTTNATKQVLVTKIEPSADLKATLTGVEYDPAVQSYDDNPPATFTSSISGTLILEPPPPPNIYAIFSNAHTGGPFGRGGGGGDPAFVMGIAPGGSGYINTGTFGPRPNFRTIQG